jgi:hypothetical protein
VYVKKTFGLLRMYCGREDLQGRDIFREREREVCVTLFRIPLVGGSAISKHRWRIAKRASVED